MNCFIIRHLPTSWNEKGILQGTMDISILPPTEEILKAIQARKEKLDPIPFDFVLASRYKRTKETAKLYGFAEPKIEPLINEIDFGVYEGEPKARMVAENTPAWQENVLDLVFGESLRDFQDRLFRFIDKYRPNENILLFSHGGVTRGLLAIHREGTIAKMNEFVVPNNHLTVLTF